MKRIAACTVIVAAALLRLSAQTVGSSTDAEIRQILADRIDRDRQSVGIVVGLLDGKGRRVIAHGAAGEGASRPLDGDTVFEIGSVTKVFTALLLADMVQRGDVLLTDPIAKYLPADVKAPERNGRVITLLDLAMHTSGLPRLPTNLAPKNPSNPYADYSIAQLHQFLSSYVLPRDPGSKYEYSNLGGGLLGQLLTRRAGQDYETLVRTQIAGPLGMTNTRISLSNDQRARLAVGYHATLAPVPNWELPTLAGAGALRSTANDLLTFLAACFDVTPSRFSGLVTMMVAERKPTGMPSLEIGLGWHILSRNGRELIWHNGGTGGYRSFIGYSPSAHTGVVVLSNTETAAGVDDIGLHVLDATLPLWQAPKLRTAIAVDPKLFDGYVGQYQLAPNFVLTVTREGDRLFAQATAQPKFELFAESEKEFFLKVVDAQLTFVTDAGGKATTAILHQNGADIPGKRVN